MRQPVILLLCESDGVGYCSTASQTNGQLSCQLDSDSELIDALRLGANKIEVGVTCFGGDQVFVDGKVVKLDSSGGKVNVIIRLSLPSKFVASNERESFLT